VTNAVRVGWLLVAVLPNGLAFEQLAGTGSVFSPWLSWAVWAMVALAVLVLHPVSLVTVRFVAPLLVADSGWRIITDRAAQSTPGAVVGFFLMLVVATVTYSAVYGAVHAQAAAYGHERRHLLRPPIAVILPIAVLWLGVAGGGAIANHAVSLPTALGGLGVFIIVGFFALRRATVLARRWLVFVPAGIAVHDPLMLQDTLMVRRHDIRGLAAAEHGTTAFDATGTTWGMVLELTLSHPHDVSLSTFGVRMAKTLDRLHVSAVLVAPSRPSAALASNSAGEHRAI
jgi:hypothetical protein